VVGRSWSWGRQSGANIIVASASPGFQRCQHYSPGQLGLAAQRYNSFFGVLLGMMPMGWTGMLQRPARGESAQSPSAVTPAPYI
jgi:hypothetical protein